MTTPPLASDLIAVVIRGEFRPVIVSPTWLMDQELIGEDEYAESAFEILLPNEMAVFKAGWLRCQATPEALEFQTEQEEEAERLRDVAVGVLRTLDNKAISALGINRHMHFAAKSYSQWDSIGNNIVHNEMWDGILDHAGMRTATFWADRADDYSGRVQVQIEPSFQVKLGVYVAYNDHYDLTLATKPPKTKREAWELGRIEDTKATTDKIPVAIDVLTDKWTASFQRSATVLEQVWKRGDSLR